jgi:hypothetical protein
MHLASGSFFEKITAPATDFLKMHLASGSFFEKIITPAADFI